jgi:hypothetical protein
LQQIKPHRLGDQHERDKVEGELKPARSLHGHSSEFLRPNHGHKQIGEQQQRDDADNDCFHSIFLEPFAKADVKRTHEKEHDDNSDED